MITLPASRFTAAPQGLREVCSLAGGPDALADAHAHPYAHSHSHG